MAEAMSSNDAWDWPLLYYTGTVLLHMKPEDFWRTTPKKLNVLVGVHIELNSMDSKKSKNKQAKYIDELWQ